MAESTLSLTMDELKGSVGFHLGYGYGVALGDTTWTTQQGRAIDRCVNAGLRQFYFPPPLPGTQSSYDWSFLRPVATLTLAEASTSLVLPDDFGGLEGQITLAASGQTGFCPVSVTGEPRIRALYAEQPDLTGRPILAGIAPVKGTTAAEGQRFELVYWPSPDQEYTARVAYYFLPDALTALLPFHSGGMLHAETVRESCLAIAEETVDNVPGVHKQKFFERLAASISHDRKFKDQVIGYNADRSDERYGRYSERVGGGATFNGTYYGE